MVGGLLAAISIGVLTVLGAVAAAVVIAVIYVGMLVVRFAVRPPRLRLGLLAGGMIAIAAIALIVVLALAATATR